MSMCAHPPEEPYYVHMRTTDQDQWRASNPAELGRALARLRQKKGLAQGELATRTGLRREYLSRMESGLATEQLQNLFSVLRATGYEIILAPREHADGP